MWILIIILKNTLRFIIKILRPLLRMQKILSLRTQKNSLLIKKRLIFHLDSIIIIYNIVRCLVFLFIFWHSLHSWINNLFFLFFFHWNRNLGKSLTIVEIRIRNHHILRHYHIGMHLLILLIFLIMLVLILLTLSFFS